MWVTWIGHEHGILLTINENFKLRFLVIEAVRAIVWIMNVLVFMMFMIIFSRATSCSHDRYLHSLHAIPYFKKGYESTFVTGSGIQSGNNSSDDFMTRHSILR